jgi:hypothetical protein
VEISCATRLFDNEVGVVDGPATEEVTSRMPGSQSVNNDLSERLLHDANHDVAVLRIWQILGSSESRS